MVSPSRGRGGVNDRQMSPGQRSTGALTLARVRETRRHVHHWRERLVLKYSISQPTRTFMDHLRMQSSSSSTPTPLLLLLV